MAVGIDEAVRIHEAKVLRLVVGGATRGEGLRHEIIDLLAALATEGNQNLHRFGRIADGLRSELAELGMCRDWSCRHGRGDSAPTWSAMQRLPDADQGIAERQVYNFTGAGLDPNRK